MNAMKQSNMHQICSISNICFEVHHRAKSISTKKLQPREAIKPILKISSQSMTRSHIDGFIPVTGCRKRDLVIDCKQYKTIQPLKGMEIEYKSFPPRKSVSSHSCRTIFRRQKQFRFGAEELNYFSNKKISQSIERSSIEKNKEKMTNSALTTYGPHRRSVSSLPKSHLF